MAKTLNFTYEIENPPDGKWGHVEPDGRWNGLFYLFLFVFLEKKFIKPINLQVWFIMFPKILQIWLFVMFLLSMVANRFIFFENIFNKHYI